jgi:hypothetical protein
MHAISARVSLEGIREGCGPLWLETRVDRNHTSPQDEVYTVGSPAHASVQPVLA